MSINIEKLDRLNKLVSLSFKRKHSIVLNPEEKINDKDELNEDIIYDEASWKITNELQEYIDKLSEDDKLSVEDKILSTYEKLCKDYVYLKEDHGFYLPLHYVGILMAYHDLFQHHYKNFKKTEQQITQLQEIFDLTNDFEIKYDQVIV